MVHKASSTFKIDSWQDAPLESLAGPYSLTKSFVAKTYSGLMKGVGRVEYLMANVSDKETEFVGVELFEGSVDGRTGAFLLRHSGTFRDGVVESRWDIVANSGRDSLAGISGSINFNYGHADEYDITLEYEM